MKQLLFILAFISILLVSCGSHYNTTPTQVYPAQHGVFKQLEAGKDQVLTYPTVYKMKATWWQAKKWGEQDGTLWIMWLGIILGPIVAIGYLVWRTKTSPLGVLDFVLAIEIWGILTAAGVGNMDWYRFHEKEILKSDYDNTKTDADWEAFWNSPAKVY